MKTPQFKGMEEFLNPYQEPPIKNHFMKIIFNFINNEA